MVITDLAKGYILNMMNEAGVSMLRFVHAGAGCCGPSYQLSLEKAQDQDIVTLVNDVEVAIDPQVAEQVNGITLDFIEDEQGAGLVIRGGSSCC